MAEHAWCRDTACDERIRAAEDGRDRPRPTLEEAIAAPFACVVCKGKVYDHRFKESCPRCGGDAETWFGHKVLSAMAIDGFRKVEEAWAMIPKSVSASSPVDQENKGDGMRTERVMLEVTHDDNDGHIQFRNWDQMLFGEQNGVRFPGESVRVVEDDRILAASKKLIEVDQEAALRGFGTTTFQRLWISAIARVLGLELARPPRSKCDNPGDGSIPSPGILASPALVEAHQQIAALTAERDAAIRERDQAKQRHARECAKCVALADKVIGLRDRVAELESAVKLAPAANADGVSNPQTISSAGKSAGDETQEPDAWGVRRKGGVDAVAHRLFRSSAEQSAEQFGGTVVPLYAAAQAAPGWLTAEQREAVAFAAQKLYELSNRQYVNGDQDAARDTTREEDFLRSILARSSPPEVVHPAHRGAPEIRERDSWWRKALAAAGVTVKEVSRG